MLSTPKKLKKIQGELAYLERHSKRLAHLKRKSDNRLTYELGLLVTKAGLRSESDEVILGLALEYSLRLSSGKLERNHYRALGDINFQFGDKLTGLKLYNEVTHSHGGLIKKALLHHESRAVILGLLIDAKEKLESKEGNLVRQIWQNQGTISLSITAN